MENEPVKDLKELINDSDYVLVGIGEEWESDGRTEEILDAYGKLAGFLSGKDFFLVTTATDGLIYKTEIDKERIVAPCGDRNYLQCKNACCEKIWKKKEMPDAVCPECGAPLVPNTVDAKPYVETGYLPQWQAYMGWLQKSLNRKLLLLELGVGFKTPTVIRWPFEKTVYLNYKSSLYRIHEKLFQLPDNLEGRGHGIAENSVRWILSQE